MNEVLKTIELPLVKGTSFDMFVNKLTDWWPKAYTWSQDTLVEIKFDAVKDGLCTEIGPFGFRCDWGRVTEFIYPNLVAFKWQIGPDRVPLPDPEKASDVMVGFEELGNGCKCILRHFNFENHGEGWQSYLKAMDSDKGWPFILDCFVGYCNGEGMLVI